MDTIGRKTDKRLYRLLVIRKSETVTIVIVVKVRKTIFYIRIKSAISKVEQSSRNHCQSQKSIKKNVVISNDIPTIWFTPTYRY